MKEQSKAKMFLSDERGLTEWDGYRCYNTFNFGTHLNEHKNRFDSLYLLNDQTLAGEKKCTVIIEGDSLVLLLPIVGAVYCSQNSGNAVLVEPSQYQMALLPTGAVLELLNPYEELINFLLIAISKPVINEDCLSKIYSFDLTKNKNCLLHHEVFNSDNTPSTSPFYIGKFDGRSEGSFKLGRAATGVFLFVIEGAFEVQNRLLHSRDGLALWHIKEVDFEALSNEAILVLIEL